VSEKDRIVGVRFQARPYGLVVAGLGLVVLGTAIWILAIDSQAPSNTQPTDFSSIPVPVSFDAPNLTLQDLTGQEQSLSGHRGSVVLVNLWATWCPPCQAEMPILESFYRQHRNSGLIVIGVEDGDPKVQVAAFVAAHGLTFPIWLDPSYQATDHAFKTSNLPTSYVIDRAGKVRLTWIGAISVANLEKYVTPLILE
jgi:thiol-disulfide isomerase/thioredoxin